MPRAIQIRMGGYGPASTGFSKSLKFIGDRLEKQFGDRVDVKYVWNIMDFGYRAEDILWLVEHGLDPGTRRLTEADRRRALELREALRALLLANGGDPCLRLRSPAHAGRPGGARPGHHRIAGVDHSRPTRVASDDERRRFRGAHAVPVRPSLSPLAGRGSG